MAKSVLASKKLIRAQGIMMIPLPTTGRISTRAIIKAISKGWGASIRTRPILKIKKLMIIRLSWAWK